VFSFLGKFIHCRDVFLFIRNINSDSKHGNTSVSLNVYHLNTIKRQHYISLRQETKHVQSTISRKKARAKYVWKINFEIPIYIWNYGTKNNLSTYNYEIIHNTIARSNRFLVTYYGFGVSDTSQTYL
jgi:hypothetical protein